MSAAPLAPQSKPLLLKICCRLTPPTGLVLPGMWSEVAVSKGTTLNSVRSNWAGNLGLIFWAAPLPTVGLMPLIAPSFIVPCRSQENQFLDGTCTQTTPLLFGEQAVPALRLVLMHLAECWLWAMKSPTE